MSQTSGGSDKPIASTLGKPDPNRIVKIRFSKPLAEKVRQQILANRKSAGASLGEAGGQAVSPTPSKVAMASDSKLEWEGKRKRVGATPSNSDKESAAERSKKRGTGVPAAAGVSDAELIADVKEEIAGAGVRRSSRKKKGAETAAALTQEEGENDESNSDSGSGSEEDSDDEGEEESEMTEEQAKEALKKAQERMTRETLSTEIEELNMKPPNATTAAWGRKVEIPLGYCFPGDSVDLGDGLEPWSVNSRQVSAAGVKAAEENFEEHGYEPEMGFMLGVVRIGGKRVPLTQEDRDAWDEVERERVETFEKKYTELAKKGGKDTPEKREAKFMVEEVIGYRVHMTDGQNRTVAYKNVQKKKYATKAADPDGSRHPVLRMYLIAVDKKNNAQVLRLSKHVNDSGRAGHDSSMGQTFMTIRRTLKTLTKEQVRRVFTPEVVRALQKAAGRKARPGSVNAEGGVRLSSLGLAMLMEEKQRAQLLDPDLDQKVRQTLETRITKLYNRLTAGAQPGLGAPWDAVLRKLTDDPELDKELRQEDFYHLTTNGVKGEWLVEAAQKMLCRPKAEAAALGWPRAKTAYKQVAAQLGFMKGVYERGHELLEEWGVYENRAAQRKEKEEAFLEGTFKEAWMRNLFTKKGGKTWKEYTWWMAFADFPEGYQYRMFLTVAQDKKNKKELREHAAKRAVIGWLIWQLGVPTEYQTTLQMSTNMPKTIRLAVLKLVGAPLTGSGQVGAGQTVFGALEADGMRKSAYRLLEECTMMCPVERDCGGRMPLAYTSFVEGERVMPSRGERAKKLGLEVRTEADLVAPEDPRKAGTTVYHVTAGEDPKQYEVGNLEETLEGLRVLNGMDETDMQKNGPFGADLLLYSALAAEEPDEELRDKLREGEKWPLPKKSEVMATMDLAASLVTGKGTIVVIAPLGMPVFWLTQPISDSVMERTGAPKGSRLNVVGQRAIFVESFRATKEKDGKERICNRVKQAVFGDSGDTFAVFYVTFTDSGVKSFVKESILTDSLEQEFLWRTMGSSMHIRYEEFMKVPGSYGKEVTLELLGPLVKPKQSAVVLNARSGMEVGMLGKAKMNVVGIYSEAWNKFPGGVVPDSKDELAKTAAQELEREMGELTAEDMAAFTAREAVVKELEEDLAEENEKETAKDLGEIPAVESAEAGDKAGPEEQVDRAMEMEEGGQTGEVA